MKVFSACPTPISLPLFLVGRVMGKRRCYVKKFTNDVIFFTYYVTFLT